MYSALLTDHPPSHPVLFRLSRRHSLYQDTQEHHHHTRTSRPKAAPVGSLKLLEPAASAATRAAAASTPGPCMAHTSAHYPTLPCSKTSTRRAVAMKLHTPSHARRCGYPDAAAIRERFDAQGARHLPISVGRAEDPNVGTAVGRQVVLV